MELAAGRVYELARQAETFERALRRQIALVERLQASVDALARENQALRVERDALRLALERGNATPATRSAPPGLVAGPRPMHTVVPGARFAPQRAA
ncbi:MAG: hypothetical protein Kow0010_24420 [Dehalococcoidia bacterium]